MIDPTLVTNITDRDSLVELLHAGLGWPVNGEAPFSYLPEIARGVKGQGEVRVSRLIPASADERQLILLAEFSRPTPARPARTAGFGAGHSRNGALCGRWPTLSLLRRRPNIRMCGLCCLKNGSAHARTALTHLLQTGHGATTVVDFRAFGPGEGEEPMTRQAENKTGLSESDGHTLEAAHAANGTSPTLNGSDATASAEWRERAKTTLGSGDVEGARRLIQEGLRQYPQDENLLKLEVLLSPPRVLGRRPSPPGTAARVAADHQWMRQHAGEYRGSWIALRNGVLLAAASSVVELQAQVGDLEDALVTKLY